MYRWSVEDPQSFWGSIAAQLHWERPWDKGQPICNYNFNLDKGPIYIKVCYFCRMDDGCFIVLGMTAVRSLASVLLDMFVQRSDIASRPT